MRSIFNPHPLSILFDIKLEKNDFIKNLDKKIKKIGNRKRGKIPLSKFLGDRKITELVGISCGFYWLGVLNQEILG